MNKKDIPLFVGLIALVVLWPQIDRILIAPMFPKKTPPPAVTKSEPAPVAGATNTTATAQQEAPAITPAPAPVAAPPEPLSAEPEQRVALTNAVVELVFSSRGAALSEATLHNYREAIAKNSGKVRLDFSAAPALAWEGLTGLGDGHDFAVTENKPGESLRFERRASTGLSLTREIRLTAPYILRIRDTFQNAGTAPVEVPAAAIRTGAMRAMPGESLMKGIYFIGLDTLSPGGGKVQFWGSKIPGFFKNAPATGSGRPPVKWEQDILTSPAEWASAKNKYFVQILLPLSNAATGVGGRFERAVSRRELEDPTFTKIPVEIESSAALLKFGAMTLAPGSEPLVREFEYYIGPKKYSELKPLTHHRSDVMEFGFFGGLSKILLVILNGIHSVIPNYGVAIILLTILVRVVFWPITHKSTESMKRMAEIQPLVQEVRKKYKEPQRQQKEMMELYRKHKINPLGGCLPILVQIPVFIALFVMLRSAIELRFGPFLWIKDLSEPENLLAGMLPFGLSLNILPLLMTITQVWQQKLTPSAGDPMQQKMMMWMPAIMLFFFYTFASGLVLYWTTNQVLMIVQLLIQKYRREHRKAA